MLELLKLIVETDYSALEPAWWQLRRTLILLLTYPPLFAYIKACQRKHPDAGSWSCEAPWRGRWRFDNGRASPFEKTRVPFGIDISKSFA